MNIVCKFAAIVSVIWLLGLHGPDSHADVFAFTDQQGVLHLSDVPADTRYQRVLVHLRSRIVRRWKALTALRAAR